MFVALTERAVWERGRRRERSEESVRVHGGMGKSEIFVVWLESGWTLTLTPKPRVCLLRALLQANESERERGEKKITLLARTFPSLSLVLCVCLFSAVE